MTIDELRNQYLAATENFADAFAAVTPENLDRVPGNGWSPRAVIHHMADAEAHSYLRLRLLLVEPGTAEIKGWDEDRWSDCVALAYRSASIDHSIELVRACRAASADLLSRLSDADLEISGTHSERGKITVTDWLQANINHANAHAEQIRNAISA